MTENDSYAAIRSLLASGDPQQLRRGLQRVKTELTHAGPEAARRLFEMVSPLFYIDPLDRPDLVPVVDEAVSLMAGFGKWVIPVLVDNLLAGDLKAQLAIGHALGRIGADAVPPLIAEYAASEEPGRRAFVLYALGKVRSPAVAEAVPLALEAAQSPDLELRDTATRAIGKFAEAIPAARLPEAVRTELVARLQANLADPNAGVRAKAVRSLGKLAKEGHLPGGESEALRAAFHRILGDDGRFEWDNAYVVRKEAEEALRYL